MWDNYVKNCGLKIGPIETIQLKLCFYLAAVSVYNTILECIRRDESLVLLTEVTAAMKKDFDQYFV